MAKIHRVIEIKLNPLVEENMSTWSLTYQQIVFVRYHRDRHSSEFLTARWRQKSTGIDMEQNYVTVTLSIVRLLFVTLVVRRWWRSGTAVTSLVESTTLLHPRGRCHSPHRYTHWLEHGRIGTGPADPTAAGPITWQTGIFLYTLGLHQPSWTSNEPWSFFLFGHPVVFCNLSPTLLSVEHRVEKCIHSGQLILRKISKFHAVRF